MIYMLCSCGALLRNKQIVYEDEMEKLCDEYDITYDMISSGIMDDNEEFKKKRSEIINRLCEKICCKINMMTYVQVGRLVVG